MAEENHHSYKAGVPHDPNHPGHHDQRYLNTLEGTNRIEAFSDAVMAIVVTLLIIEIKVPVITVFTSAGAWSALVSILPEITGFVVSFFTVSVFWVNHHHFFHPIKKSDSVLMWHNNYLLLWIAIIPFVTEFTGEHSDIPLVVALYGFVLFMAALAFTLMNRYVFFHCSLLPESITYATRRRSFRRSLIGVVLYGLSVPLAFVHPDISLAIFVIVPLYYFLPRGLKVGE